MSHTTLQGAQAPTEHDTDMHKPKDQAVWQKDWSLGWQDDWSPTGPTWEWAGIMFDGIASGILDATRNGGSKWSQSEVWAAAEKQGWKREEASAWVGWWWVGRLIVSQAQEGIVRSKP